MIWRAVILWGVFCLASLALAAAWYTSGPSVFAVDARLPELVAVEARPGLGGAFDDRDGESLDVVTSRPLFWVSRKPLTDSPEPSAPEPQVEDDPGTEGYALIGVLYDGEEPVVVLRTPDGRVIRRGHGDRIGALTIDHVEPDAVRFVSGQGDDSWLRVRAYRLHATPAEKE
ncbi:MAG: hypothetical protein ACP5DC_02940 [Halothiobacillaceae bacterium]